MECCNHFIKFNKIPRHKKYFILLQHLKYHALSNEVNIKNLKIKEMNITELLMPVAVLGTFGAGVVLFAKTITDYFLRKKMVEKGYVNPENSMLLKKLNSNNRLEPLKWGLLILSSGIGLVIIDSIELKENSTLPFGIFAICLSVGFLAYFVIAKNMSGNDKE